MGDLLKRRARLKKMVAPHVESFNWFVEKGLGLAVADLQPVRFEDTLHSRVITLKITSAKVGRACKMVPSDLLYPHECRQTQITYSAPLTITFSYSAKEKDGKKTHQTLELDAGRIPVMLGSKICNLDGKTPAELVRHQEEETEVGGYFIVNGNEKVIRMLITQRKNYPIGLSRPQYKKSGPNFSSFALNVRCGRPDQTTKSMMLHYLTNGDCRLRIVVIKGSWFFPPVLLLRALVQTTDREIYEKLVAGDFDDTFIGERAEMLLRQSQGFKKEKKEALVHLGQLLKEQFQYVPGLESDEDIANHLLKNFICVHADSFAAKADFLILMIRKLYFLAKGTINVENPDQPSVQELVLPGQILNVLMKEKLQSILEMTRASLAKELRFGKQCRSDWTGIQKYLGQFSQTLTQKVTYFLATGNFPSTSQQELGQMNGFVVGAERVNYLRFISHFRVVHRGAFFTQMRTTAVRKLLPTSWGFFCPVHTPDGAPCGLLNHLALNCRISRWDQQITDIAAITFELGKLGMHQNSTKNWSAANLPVIFDGQLLGFVPEAKREKFEDAVRLVKIRAKLNQSKTKVQEPSTVYRGVIDANLEVVVMPRNIGQFPSIWLFSHTNRLMRPVINRKHGRKEMIGSLEQTFLTVAIKTEEINTNTTHIEPHPTSIFSLVASLTPFCDNNQSPRNMYQCQMLKQTMGTPIHSWPYRVDTKMFRILTPQTPIVKNMNHDRYPMDNYLTGTNAVVAVLAYTGYDMEDAMIINKSAFERGFGHGYVYKTEYIDLTEELFDHKTEEESRCWFSNKKDDGSLVEPGLDDDGLPYVGELLREGDPFYCKWDLQTGTHYVAKFKGKEPSYVEGVLILGYKDNAHTAKGELGNVQKVAVQLRLNRRPARGDKFSSRHGQKGVLSQLYPQVDLPFSESGMCPDIIINPHAFPSRMTIGMLIESMAGKAGALHAFTQDSTPFQFDEKNMAVDHFGKQLLQAGYNYYGNETMYSGISGQEFEVVLVEIFLGVVYYQRLRHMVGDKYQVRATGRKEAITQQPVHGRKIGGGTRFGEMERDSILAHGASFLLHDRLMNCSDLHYSPVCVNCGCILNPVRSSGETIELTTYKLEDGNRWYCNSCQGQDQNLRIIAMPFITRYLIAELAAMNIRVSLDLKTPI